MSIAAIAYNGIGRPITRNITSDTTYQIDMGYDPTTGLMSTLTYPTSTSAYRLKVQYGYSYGILCVFPLTYLCLSSADR